MWSLLLAEARALLEGKTDSLVRRVVLAFMQHARAELDRGRHIADFHFDLGDGFYVTLRREPLARKDVTIELNKAATFDPQSGEVLLRFRTDKRTVDKKDWPGFLKDLKTVLRHELEHVAQFQRAERDADYPSYWKIVGGSKHFPVQQPDAATLADVFLTVDATIAYLTNPAETEANVASIVHAAKHSRSSAHSEMEAVLDELNLTKHLSANEANKVRTAVRAAWVRYGMARYPKVFKKTP